MKTFGVKGLRVPLVLDGDALYRSLWILAALVGRPETFLSVPGAAAWLKRFSS